MTRHLVLEREADAIAVHDSIPSLRREALLATMRGLLYAFVVAVCFYLPLLMWEDVKAGVADRRTRSMMFLLPVMGLVVSGYVLRDGLRLWRVTRRLLDGSPDLRITAEGIENRWSGEPMIGWTDIAYARPAVGEFGLRLDIVLRAGADAPASRKLENLSPSYRLDDMPVLFDTLYVIARYVPVAWLPHGYRPAASVLQDWPVPPQNRVYLPGGPPEELLGSGRFVTLRHRHRRRLLFVGLFMLPVSFLMIYIGWGAVPLPSIREISFLWMLKWLGPVCVLAALLCIRIGLAANYQLQADRHGVRLARLPAYGIIPWVQIFDVALLGWTDYRIVAFAVADLPQREARLPWYKRWLYRLRRRGKPMLNCILRYEKPGEVRAAHIMMAAWQEQAWWTSSAAWLAAWHVRGREPSGR